MHTSFAPSRTEIKARQNPFPAWTLSCNAIWIWIYIILQTLLLLVFIHNLHNCFHELWCFKDIFVTYTLYTIISSQFSKFVYPILECLKSFCQCILLHGVVIQLIKNFFLIMFSELNRNNFCSLWSNLYNLYWINTSVPEWWTPSTLNLSRHSYDISNFQKISVYLF